MKHWMNRLASHYTKVRERHPEDRLIILFDIDGTILDMRHMMLAALQTFDKNRGTHLFKDLRIEDVTVHENQIEQLFTTLDIEGSLICEILDWYSTHRWLPEALWESHRPFVGVMEVIRWFQIQPNTYVGLNTGRPGSLRFETLHSLNRLGREYKVAFRNDLLYMNPRDWEEDVPGSKVAGVSYFRKNGYRVFAFVDNEPKNLQAVGNDDPENDILLLHADTIFESQRKALPQSTVSGKDYDITELINEQALPQHIQFVWHGVNDEVNLKQFLASNVRWSECDVRMNPAGTDVVLRHDSFQETPAEEDEQNLLLEETLKTIVKAGKSLKLDLKEAGFLLHHVIGILKNNQVNGSHLWFNGRIEVLKEDGFRRLARAFPGALLQCPVDFLIPLLVDNAQTAQAMLEVLTDWGINRFSVNWNAANVGEVVGQMEQWGFDVNIHSVPDLEGFLKAALLLPKSITSDFNFPKWNYFGRGPGEHQRHFEYTLTDSELTLGGAPSSLS